MMMIIFTAVFLVALFQPVNSQPAEIRTKRKNRQILKANTEREEREKMMKENSLKQKPKVSIPDESLEEKMNVDTSRSVEELLMDTSFLPVDKQALLTCSNVDDPSKYAIASYWKNYYLMSFTCAQLSVSKNKNVDMMQSILYSLSRMRNLPVPLANDKVSTPANSPPSAVKEWELLGPLPSGKLELDADPTFESYGPNFEDPNYDIALYLLRMPSDSKVFSELVQGGVVSWQSKVAKASTGGLVEANFKVPWSDLIQSLGSREALEFQGWARAVTYARKSGPHTLDCHGTHTVYVRNGGYTRLLSGDVYHSGEITASTDLQVGPVGIVLPLRGAVKSVVGCTLTEVTSTETVRAFPMKPFLVPDLLEDPLLGEGSVLQDGDPLALPHTTAGGPRPVRKGWGYLLSPYLSLSVLNLGSSAMRVGLTVETPLNFETTITVKVLSATNVHADLPVSPAEESVEIEGGQIAALPLKLLARYREDQTISLPCRRGFTLLLVVTPAKGEIVKVPLELSCRGRNQSIVFTYLDHDGSVSSAAFLFPLIATPTSPRGLPSQTCPRQGQGIADGEGGQSSPSDCDYKERTGDTSFPVLLSLHGTGVEARNQADAYKNAQYSNSGRRSQSLGPSAKPLRFGVEGFFVLAPTRHGAHNWEGVGQRSALRSRAALVDMLSSHPHLPQASSQYGIFAGHSMGGHGAWVTATSHPDSAVCVVSAAGWLRKEDYGDANAFFGQDAGGAYTDPELRSILSRCMSEGHTDSLVDNVRGLQSWIRVGSEDRTTHPFYARRMHRLLHAANVSTRFEEVSGKEHWWWDSSEENDGGVLNDRVMRGFYASCLRTSEERRDFDLVGGTKGASVEGLMEGTVGGSKLSETLDSWRRLYGHCLANFKLVVFSPYSHGSTCGLQIQTQYRSNSRSTVTMTCVDDKDTRWTGEGAPVFTRCKLRTRNVLRLSIDLTNPVYRFVDHVTIEDLSIVITDSPSAVETESTLTTSNHPRSIVDVCWGQGEDNRLAGGDVRSVSPRVCRHPPNALQQKSRHVSGPIRQVASRPLMIVYGTPQDPLLRKTLREHAVYLANSYYTSHLTFVRVMSDVHFKATVANDYAYLNTLSSSQPQPMGFIFVGGPSTNKMMRSLAQGSAGPFRAHFAGLSFHSNATTTEEGKSHRFSEEWNGFSIGSFVFDQPGDGVLASFPLQYTPAAATLSEKEQKRMKPQLVTQTLLGEAAQNVGVLPYIGECLAMVIHSSSRAGYHHLSRLAWPTVPPMVRAPYANYLPDYVVTNADVWKRGFGGVNLIGFWSSDWKYDVSDSFSNM